MAKSRAYRQVPAYPIDVVDKALALVEMLRDFGAVRLSDAARQLRVSPSTAHRLMAMLVYRGFAEQDASKRYLPGPAMGIAPVEVWWTAELRRRAQPHLDQFAEDIDEAVNLVIRVGAEVRFLATAPGTQLAGVGDRQGAVMPAERTSAGKAILASLGNEQVKAIYQRQASEEGRAFDIDWFRAMTGEFEGIRRNGFAANFEGTEAGVCALGVTVCDGAGIVVGGLTVAVPKVRFRRVFEDGLVPRVTKVKRRLELDLANFVSGPD